MQNSKNQKIFLIINLSYFGDVLLTNTLCQNIKLNYPDSKVVMLVDKPFYEAAKYQYCVDDTIYFDKKKENKGILGLLKFVIGCKYKNKIYAAFVMYDNDRGILLSYFLHAQKRISGPNKILKWMLTDIHFERKNELVHMEDINGDFIRALTGKNGEILPVKYLTNPRQEELTQKIAKEFQNKELIGLCTVSKQKDKDMPLETAIEIINDLSSKGKTVLLFGAGEECRKYRDKLKAKGCLNFVDLTDKTTIYQMANIMQLCKAIISIDTGTMHLAYASGRPTVCIFYKKDMITKWAPRKSLYPHTVVIDKNYTAENIIQNTKEIIKNYSPR